MKLASHVKQLTPSVTIDKIGTFARKFEFLKLISGTVSLTTFQCVNTGQGEIGDGISKCNF